LFRDWLRAQPAEREVYAALKRQLAEEHALREDYAEAKEPWFSEVAWPRMQEWASRTGWVSPV
jgi:dephospho-CoA kinase